MIQRPILMTCGDPTGIGPEICGKAWQELRQDIALVYVGDSAHLDPSIPTQIWQKGAAIPQDRLAVLPIVFKGSQTLGHLNLDMAQGTITSIETAVSLAKNGDAAAICTAPIHKKVLQDGAGFSFPGHTEFLSHLAGNSPVVMMLASPILRVVPATIHIPLSDVPAALTANILHETIQITADGLKRDFGILAPRIIVAGIDPHAGEGGNIGTIDRDRITPIVEGFRAQGLNIWGPMSADTMFHSKARDTYDAAICMYHDQALIPIKTLDFDRGVNVTLGLPFVRTSPDHGTAHDIAGKSIANPSSMIEAVKMAAEMAKSRVN